MTGEKTSVHKPLSNKGHAFWLDGDVGYIIQKRFTDSDSDAHVFRKSLCATLVE